MNPGFMDQKTLVEYFLCPVCHSDLAFEKGILKCRQCACIYPIIRGIPDFRNKNDQTAGNVLYAESERDHLALVLKYFDSAKTHSELVRIVSEEILRRDEAANINQRRKDHRIWCREESLLHFRESGDVLYEKFYQQLISESSYIPNTQTALDFGCGNGLDIYGLKKHFSSVFAMDISLPHLLYAKKMCESCKLENVIIFCANGERLPIRDSSFDYVQSNNVIEHVKNIDCYAKEMYRVLHQGGFGFIASPNRYSYRKEMHVQINFIGFLPRKYMDPVARVSYSTSPLSLKCIGVLLCTISCDLSCAG